MTNQAILDTLDWPDWLGHSDHGQKSQPVFSSARRRPDYHQPGSWTGAAAVCGGGTILTIIETEGGCCSNRS